MSYHIFPAGGGQQHLPGGVRRRLNLAHLEPLQNASVLNTGWNDTMSLPLNSTRHLMPLSMREAHWEPPTVNVLPTAMSRTATLSFPSKAFGSTTRRAEPLPPTPLQSVGRRSEHWYSDPIHGVFSTNVVDVPNRFATRCARTTHPSPPSLLRPSTHRLLPAAYACVPRLPSPQQPQRVHPAPWCACPRGPCRCARACRLRQRGLALQRARWLVEAAALTQPALLGSHQRLLEHTLLRTLALLRGPAEPEQQGERSLAGVTCRSSFAGRACRHSQQQLCGAYQGCICVRADRCSVCRAAPTSLLSAAVMVGSESYTHALAVFIMQCFASWRDGATRTRYHRDQSAR